MILGMEGDHDTTGLAHTQVTKRKRFERREGNVVGGGKDERKGRVVERKNKVTPLVGR